jgi:sugar phosphate isomerase/epimerase
MKLSFITDEATQDPAAFVALARRHGLDAVELRSVEGEPVYRFEPARLRALRDLLRANGLNVCCLDTPVFKSEAVADPSPDIEKLRLALRAAAALETPLVRIFTFWKPAGRDTEPSLIEHALERAHAEVHGSGLRLLVENGKRTNHQTGMDLAALLDTLCPQCFGVVWDPGNSLLGGADPDPVANGYAALRGRIAHVHVKDPKLAPDGSREYVELGRGDLRIRDQVAALHADGYTGYLSLETHWRTSGRLTEEQMDAPYGEAFSSSGFEATELSLRTLQAWTKHARAVV